MFLPTQAQELLNHQTIQGITQMMQTASGSLKSTKDPPSSWILSPLISKASKIVFSNIVSLETSIESNILFEFHLWSYDFLTIYDGDTIFDNQIDKVTGDSLPNSYNVLSTNSKLLLSFESDESETRFGFSIQYEASKLLSDCLYQILELYKPWLNFQIVRFRFHVLVKVTSSSSLPSAPSSTINTSRGKNLTLW